MRVHDTPPPTVALLLMPQHELGRAALRGIVAWARPRHWRLALLPWGPGEMPDLAGHRPDGILVQPFYDSHALATVRSLGLPTVAIPAPPTGIDLPTVTIDDSAIGRLAAEHLLQRGFRHLAFLGFPGHGYSDVKLTPFLAVARAAGIEPAIGPALRDVPHWQRPRLVGDWLAGLPRPLACFAPRDHLGVLAIDGCRAAGLRVPEEVAVLGSDDDPVWCTMADPPLSSILVPYERMGQEAAAMLDRLLAGEPPPEEALVLPPVAVVVRRSSDIFAVDDPDLVAVLRLMHREFRRPLSVNRVLARVPITRRTLERRFRALLGRGFIEELRRIRVAEAKRLLIETDLPIDTIATHSGLHDSWQLARSFRRIEGVTPSAFRAQCRT